MAWPLAWAAVGLNLADAIMTHQAVAIGFVELNPVAASLITAGWFLHVKAVFCLPILGMAWLPAPRLAVLGLCAIVVMFALIVAWNAGQFLTVILDS